MSDQRASMEARLASLNAVSNPTAKQAAAAANISAALARMSDYACKAPKGGKTARTITFHDREFLMKVASDQSRHAGERDRANAILNGGADISEGDAEFINRASG